MALELCQRSLVIEAGKIIGDAPTMSLAVAPESPAVSLFRTSEAPVFNPATN